MLFKKLTQNIVLTFLVFNLIISCKSDDDLVNTDDDPSQFSGEIEWVKTYGGSREDDANDIIETPDGGYAVLGFTLSNDGDITDKAGTDADFWVFKTDTDGNLLWSKTFGGSSDDRATKIINTADGGLAIIGYTRSNDGDVSVNNGFYDFWLLKLDASGNILWEKTYGFAGNDQGQSLIQTTNGGYFLAGFMDFDGRSAQQSSTNKSGNRHGVGEFWGIQTDASGNQQWNTYFGGTNNDRAYDVVQTPDGGFLMIGNSESEDFDITNPKGSYDFWVVKTTPSGAMEWQKNYGGSGIEIAYSISKTNDGNYLILGDTRSSDQDVTNSKGNADSWLLKINETGDLLWQKTYGGSQFDTGRKVIEAENGELILFGTSRSNDLEVSSNYGQSDFWLNKTNANGELIFEKNYGGSNLEFCNSGIVTTTGNIILTGSTESNDFDIPNNQGSKDVLLIKLK